MNGKIRPLPTQQRLRELFSYCPQTGHFTRIKGIKKGAAGTIAGTVSLGYLQIGVDWSIYRAHRLAWRYMTGEDPGDEGLEIDHVNGDRLDNRFCNLRKATHAQNTRNKVASRSSATGCKGVYFDKDRNKFAAEVIHESKRYRLGRFETLDEAKAARDAAAKALHKQFFKS
jgi:hypothetical protein